MEIAEWIRPNWKNAEQYQNHGDSLYLWYWEFLRRREDYQQDFYKFAPSTYEFFLNLDFYKERGFKILTPNDVGFTAKIPGCIEKYSITECPNPAIDKPPRFYYQNGSLILGSNEEHRILSVTFDLSMPIEKQLEAAKKTLEMWQKFYLYKKTGNEDPKLIQQRAHVSKWVSYLRALDAVYDGQTLEEIGLCIEPPDDENESDNRTGKQIGQKLVNAARKVQFNFPF